MTRYTTLAAVAIGLAVVGCQHSGHAEATPDANRPAMASGTVAADSTVYAVPYVAKTDTPWMNTSIDTTAAGTLKTGETVYVRSDAPSTGVIGARTVDGKVIYIRASDFRPK